jgi:acetolactate synthase small subunit
MLMNNKVQEKIGTLLEVLAIGIMDIRAEMGAFQATSVGSESAEESIIKSNVRTDGSAVDQLAAKPNDIYPVFEETDRREEKLDAIRRALELKTKELFDAEQLLREIQTRADAAQATIADIERHTNQVRETSERLDERIREMDERESNLIEREKCAIDTLEVLAKRSDWVKSLLPRWSEDDDFSPARRAIIEDCKGSAEPESACAGLLAASLAGYSFALRDPDDRNLADTVRDVGRRLFAWLRVRGTDVSQAAELARTVAAHINKECTGRCDVEVPTPGGPAQNQTMLFQPRPGTSDQTVVTVQSWCVRGSKREVIHRASINL